ncbi:hypothetical protein AWU67_07080 [Microterricola viridarii]|uniref:histidine kinase n=1 Tax=Microterricola viridarii TaxID=412690 RepID=A0A0X8E381_9MICO|nr:hypothetical protein AWU67_07080 [Microterricola viridarii]
MFRTLTLPQRVADFIGAGLFFAFFALLVVGMAAPVSGWAVAADLVVLGLYSVALALRRLSPTLSLSLAWAGAVLQMVALRDVQPGNLAILMVLYAVGAYGSRLVRRLGLASAILGAVLSALYLMAWLPVSRGGTASDLWSGMFLFTLFASFAVLALPWMLGMLASARRLSRESKLQQIEAEREAERAEYAVVVEQERNRIARDMHDVVAHSLAVVIAQADGARYAAQGNPELAATSLSTIAATAREALADVRLLLTELRHSEAEGPQPTIHDLERLIEQLRATGLKIDVSSTGAVLPMSASHQIAVYRIVQEALTNALRHGDATQPVGLALQWINGGVRVTITSRARKQAPAPAPASLGHGIPGMRERALLTGGNFTAGGTGAGLFEVIAWIPSGAALNRPYWKAPHDAHPRCTRRRPGAVPGRHPHAGRIAARPRVRGGGRRWSGRSRVGGVCAPRRHADGHPDAAAGRHRRDGGDRGRRAAQPRVLVLTTFDLDESAARAIRAGASGFVLKDADPEFLLAAIRTVHAGNAVIAASATRELLEHFAARAPQRDAPARFGTLTPREGEIFLLTAKGLSNTEIAAREFLSEATVKTHVSRILGKLGLRDRVQLVVFAFEHNLVD